MLRVGSSKKLDPTLNTSLVNIYLTSEHDEAKGYMHNLDISLIASQCFRVSHPTRNGE